MTIKLTEKIKKKFDTEILTVLKKFNLISAKKENVFSIEIFINAEWSRIKIEEELQ